MLKNKKAKFKAAPLPGSFMVSSILGFAISAAWVYPQSVSFGIAFMIVFVIMFLASLISMFYGSEEEELKEDKEETAK